MGPIQYQVTQPQELGGISVATVRDFRGVNSFDPLSIADSFWTDMSNLTTDDYPAASVRPGYTVLGNAIGTKVLGMGIWKDAELHVVFNDGSWRKWTGAAWTTLASGLNTAAMWSFTNFQGSLTDINLIAANGIDPVKRYDGATVQNLTGAPSGGNYITTYQNRLWCAVGKELHSCALDRPTDWTDFSGTEEDSYVKDIESSRGENINMLSGSLTKLTIGMPNAIRELYGGVPSDFADRLITEDAGFASNQAAVTHDGIMRLLHRTGIYEYAGGAIPSKDFSETISDYPFTVNADSAAGSDGTKIYFKVSNAILAYDPRSGVNAWSIWQGIDASFFTVMQGMMYVGDSVGRVLRLGGLTDAGAPITWFAITKAFSSSTIAQMMRWLKLWFAVEMAEGSTLNVSLSPSVTGNDWTLVKSIVGDGSMGVQRVLVPVDEITLAKYVRIKIDGTGWIRLHDHTRKQRALPLY